MMYQYQVFVWEDAGGLWNVAPVEDLDDYGEAEEELLGIGESERAAKLQLTAFLGRVVKEYDFWPEPGLKEARCTQFSVALRPEYHEKRRSLSTGYQVRIPFVCVHGELDKERRFAAVPYLGLRFHYFKGDVLKELFAHQVQQFLKGNNALELASSFPPENYRLDTITLKVPALRRRHRAYTPELRALSAVAEALDQRAGRRRMTPAWEREREVADLLGRLSEEKSNIILVGESGLGKSTVLVEAVRRLSNKDKPEQPRFWLSSAQRIIAGMKYLGEWEQRCEDLIEELEEIDGILCLDNLLELVRVGGQGPTDSVASFFLPYLRSRELRLIAESTPAELDACRRLLPGFIEHFQLLSIENLGHRQVLSILERMGQQAEQNEGLSCSHELFEQIYRLFSHFYPYSPFPGRAARFLRQLLDLAHQQKSAQIGKKQAIEFFIRQSGLPELFLQDDLPLSPEEIFEELRADVIGQDAACRVAADVIATFKAGLNDPQRPIGVMLFCGPTGVGKTQLAKSIANFCFGQGEEKQRLLRLDMSEYSMPGAAERLGGSESVLIKAIRRQPFLVLLLDEIEKASQDIFDMLLGVFDEGRLCDPYGRVSNFRSAIIIMTSNLGVKHGESIGFDSSADGDYEREIKQFFRPEFYNRIDEVLNFSHLSQKYIRTICEKELRSLEKREGLQKRRITLEWSDSVIDYFAVHGYEKRYGARNLQRAIEERIVTPLARYLLEHPDLSHRQLRLDAQVGGDAPILIS